MDFIRRLLMGMFLILVIILAGLIWFDRTSRSGGTSVTPSADQNAGPSQETTPSQPAATPSAPQESAAPSTPASTPTSGDVGNAANASLHINDAGLQIIEESEGLRLEAYQGPGGWYIGYGHSGASSGQKISQAEAVRLLREDVKGAEDYVRRLVTVPLNENEFSALVSFCFNVGGGNFGKSDILEKVNAGDRKGAADALLTHNKAGGKVLDHLTKRREEERTLFLTPA
ncbi:MAG TPA: glycoside hydrolase family protein [Parvularculaceae bacterium]|nr:glycoside hydrolase family protein [Parvularculaceae bacterium]